MLQFNLSKMRHLLSHVKSVKRYNYNTVAIKRPRKPECKFENDDNICLPKKRCVPSTTVCHTLPKQNCPKAITTPAQKKPMDSINYQHSPSATYADTSYVPPSRSKFQPSDENITSSLNMAYRFLKFQVKAIFAGGSIYLTSKYGVWGNSTETAELYGKARDGVATLMKDNSIPVGDVPDSREIISSCKHYWNKGVIVSVATLMELPSMISHWSRQLFDITTSKLSPDSKPNPK